MLEGPERSILQLSAYRDSLPPTQQKKFNNIFNLKKGVPIPLVYPSEDTLQYLAAKFRASPDSMRERDVLRVINRVWGEETLYNLNRANKPIQSGSNDRAEKALATLEENNPEGDDCDFCSYPTRTPGDPFGDARGEFTVTRANGAGYDGLHSLILDPRVHSYRNLTGEVITDMVHAAVKWVYAANEYANSIDIADAEYPFFMMNSLPRAGASVFHLHMQALLAIGEPYALAKNLKDRMSDYQWLNEGRAYFDDLVECLSPLDLVARVANANVIFNPAPKKDAEVIVVADDLEGMPNGSLSAGMGEVIEWWRSIGMTSFNMGIYMPRLGESLKVGSWHMMKPFARMVARGSEGNGISDIGGMEMYAGSVVAVDPFRLAREFAIYRGNRQVGQKGLIDQAVMSV